MDRPVTLLVADTESNVPGKNDDVNSFKTEIWGCGYGLVGGDKVEIFSDIETMFDSIYYCYALCSDVVVYFHNLAWDGALIVDWLMRRKGYKRGDKPFKLKKNEFSTMISSTGNWYQLRFKWKKKIITLRDSLKILPFSVDAIGKGFDCAHKKLKGEIDYTVKRHEGWHITDSERMYIENDIFVIMEALDKVRDYGLLDHLTIGGACLDFYKTTMGRDYNALFPHLSEELDREIRKSYRGGWCYVNPKYENKKLVGVNGYTYDVNSLYPYSMHSRVLPGDPKHIFPCGEPIGYFYDYEGFERYKDFCYFIKFRADFTVKKGKLPFIQIKKSRFKENEYIRSSNGPVEIMLTKPDFELFLEHYDLESELEIVEGWAFNGMEGIFDKYIDHWFAMKAEATKTGNKVLRQLSKLFLNNLYGKMATSLVADSKIPRFDVEKDKVVWDVVIDSKDGVYIPAGAYITAYARCKTVRAAQANYDIFCYADTDSVHCVGECTALQVDDVMLGAWANESRWDKARFVRQKTYIERTVVEDGAPCEAYWNIKACGCPDSVKKRLVYRVELWDDLDVDGDVVLNERRPDDEFMDRFTYGLEESGKLMRKTVSGGCILFNSTFKMNR